MTIERIENGAVIKKPQDMDAFRFNGQDYVLIDEVETRWKDGALLLADVTIQKKSVEFKPIQTLIEIRSQPDFTETIDSLWTSSIIGVTRGKNGCLRAHMYDTGREEQIWFANHPDLRDGYFITLSKDHKNASLINRIIEYSEDLKRSFNIPAKDIEAYVQQKGGRSDYDSNDYVQKVLTVDGARTSGAFIYKLNYGNVKAKDPNGPKGFVSFVRPEVEDGEMQIRFLQLGSVSVVVLNQFPARVLGGTTSTAYMPATTPTTSAGLVR